MRIAIIGPYPPIYGGVSVHVKRMKKILEKNNIDVTVYNESKINSYEPNVVNIGSYKKFIFKIPFIKAEIMHFHCDNPRLIILLGIYKAFGKKIVLTFHGDNLQEELGHSNAVVRYFAIKSLKKIDKIICVNNSIFNELLNLGFDKNKFIMLPAYCTPMEEEEDFKNIPEYVWTFITASKFLISANGCVRFNNGEDLYGIDMIIGLLYRLKENGYNTQCIFALLAKENQASNERRYYKELIEKIYLLNLEEDILIYEAVDTEFYPIIKESNLFLRPTNTDGYGVSIAEAIYYNVPAIASDVCVRPEGTILFQSRNVKDLYDKTIQVINNYEKYKRMLNNVKIKNNGEKLLEIYKEI